MRAYLKHYRQSPRKVRLIAKALQGKRVSHAEKVLDTTVKRAADPMLKLIKSAIANARENDKITNTDDLIIKEFRVDEGPTLKRYMPRARGAAHVIRKRTSNILITLEQQNKKEEAK